MKTSLSLALLLTGVLAASLAAPAAHAQTGSSRYTITPIADNYSNPSLDFATFSEAYPAINDNGTVVFRAQLSNGNEVLYSSVGGVLTLLADPSAAGSPITGFSDTGVALNNNGTVVVAGYTVLTSGDAVPALFETTQGGGTPSVLVSGADDSFKGGVKDPSINDAGTVACGAGLDMDSAVNVPEYFTIAPGGTPTLLYIAYQFGVGQYPPVINAVGQVAFILDPGNTNPDGSDPGQEILRFDPSSAMATSLPVPTTIAAKGTQFADFANDYSHDIDLDASGQVLFRADNVDGSQGVYIGDGSGSFQTVVTAGVGNTFSSFYGAGFGKAEAIVLDADLAAGGGGPFDGTDSSADYIFTDPFMGGNFTALSGVGHGQINSSGQIVFTYELDNGYKGIAVATPGVASTPAPTPTPTPTPTTPVVTIGPATGKTYENGGKIKLVVSRTGDISAALTVAYSVKGSAKSGSNFKPLPGTVVIPAGSDSVLLKIKIKDDHVVDGTHVLKLTLLAGDGYTVGTGAETKIKILDAD